MTKNRYKCTIRGQIMLMCITRFVDCANYCYGKISMEIKKSIAITYLGHISHDISQIHMYYKVHYKACHNRKGHIVICRQVWERFVNIN